MTTLTQSEVTVPSSSPDPEPVGPLASWRVGNLDADVEDHLAWCRDLRGYTEATLRHRTWTLYRLRATIDRPLRDAQVGHVQFWEQTVVAGLAAQSRRAYVGHVKAFYRWAITRGIVTDDPTVMLTRPKVPKPLPRPIGERELAYALDAAAPKLAAMMTLMAYCGLRAMEVANLTWADIASSDGQTWLTIRCGKGQRDRIVPVGDIAVRALRRHGTRTRGHIFLGRDGKQMRAHSVSQIVNTHLRRLSIPSTAHKLRARYATQAAQVLDTALVAELCGWESLETARHYIKPDRARALQLVKALDALALPIPRSSLAPAGAGQPA